MAEPIPDAPAFGDLRILDALGREVVALSPRDAFSEAQRVGLLPLDVTWREWWEHEPCGGLVEVLSLPWVLARHQGHSVEVWTGNAWRPYMEATT